MYDYYYSVLAKQTEKDFFKDFHGAEFIHRYHLYRRNRAGKGRQRNRIGRFVSLIKTICSSVRSI